MQIIPFSNPGKVKTPEDSLIFWTKKEGGWFGAADGTSGVHLPNKGPRLFDGKTGGQVASQVLSIAFGLARCDDKPEDVLRKANLAVGKIAKANKIPLQESHLLPSTTYAVAKIDTKRVTVMQGGDALAVWELTDGTIGGTPNRMFSYERFLLQTIASILRRNGGNQLEMWREFAPILAEKRKANYNKPAGGFSILNGQPEFDQFWQKFTFRPDELSLLILFSDGLVSFEWTEDPVHLAKKVIGRYCLGGFEAVLAASREIAKQNAAISHESEPEATAVAIEF
jgi:serine/threonine protein phosphatase PrpC